MADALPPQRGNIDLEMEERVRDLLVEMGLQEVVTYRLTSQEREARILSPGYSDDVPYLQLANPITSDRNVLRHSLLASLMEVAERNARLRERLALFEIGSVFIPSSGKMLPDEPAKLAILLTGPRSLPAWQEADTTPMNFYDLKGIIATLLENLRLSDVHFTPREHPTFHPGKCASLGIAGRPAGVFGELHPLVREHYELSDSPLLAAELDLDTITRAIPLRFQIQSVPAFPPMLEDLAVVIDEAVPAERVEALLLEAGGSMVTAVRLFDVYRGDQIGAGKKSLAYNLTYQAPDRTLTDDEAAEIRGRIVRRLEQELEARLRS